MASFVSFFLLAARAHGAGHSEGTAMLQSTRADLQKEFSEQIPRILHRVMLPREDGGVDCDPGSSAEMMMKTTRNNFHNNNAGWSEIIWGREAIEQLINSSKFIFKSHPAIADFPDVYLNMDEWIYQQDVIRHVILYNFGGLYMDLDMDCTGNVDDFLKDAQLVLRAKAKTNFMATVPRHQFSIDMMRRIGTTFKKGLDPVVENRPTAIWLTGEKQINETLMSYGINATIDDYPHGKTFHDDHYGRVRLMGTLQVENTPNGKTILHNATCVHGMQNSWHNKGGTIPAVAEHPKDEVELAKHCKVLYDDRTLWGSELIKWMKTAQAMYEYLGARH